jgi:hypothetical protein
MAGLQYYFFPTDFYYPKPQSIITQESSNNLQQAVVRGDRIENRKHALPTDDVERANTLAIRQIRKANLIKTSTFSLKLRKPVAHLQPKPHDFAPN